MNVGSEILGYEVLATLGYGARSTIFAVKDGHNQVYAMKRVVKSSPTDQRFIDQAIHEHEIAVRLNHPTLRKSYKLYKQRALLRTNEVYVLMELIDGLTFEQYRPDGMAHLCELMILVAQGLGSMHTAGFVHADIKPNNIIVTSSDTIKIIDFGQSCPTGTIKQRIQGTPDYIAPEQVLRRQITPQTDIFNFGATLYWLLTNQHFPTLLPKGDPTMTLRMGPAKSPRDVNANVAPSLSQLVMHCLETEPLRRPETMEAVVTRLQVAIAQIRRNDVNAALPTPTTPGQAAASGDTGEHPSPTSGFAPATPDQEGSPATPASDSQPQATPSSPATPAPASSPERSASRSHHRPRPSRPSTPLSSDDASVQRPSQDATDGGEI